MEIRVSSFQVICRRAFTTRQVNKRIFYIKSKRENIPNQESFLACSNFTPEKRTRQISKAELPNYGILCLR